jgi:hypothetical protein
VLERRRKTFPLLHKLWRRILWRSWARKLPQILPAKNRYRIESSGSETEATKENTTKDKQRALLEIISPPKPRACHGGVFLYQAHLPYLNAIFSPI